MERSCVLRALPRVQSKTNQACLCHEQEVTPSIRNGDSVILLHLYLQQEGAQPARERTAFMKIGDEMLEVSDFQISLFTRKHLKEHFTEQSILASLHEVLTLQRQLKSDEAQHNLLQLPCRKHQLTTYLLKKAPQKAMKSSLAASTSTSARPPSCRSKSPTSAKRSSTASSPSYGNPKLPFPQTYHPCEHLQHAPPTLSCQPPPRERPLHPPLPLPRSPPHPSQPQAPVTHPRRFVEAPGDPVRGVGTSQACR